MNVPKLRFRGFDSEWDTIDLKNIFNYFSTNSLSREQLSDNGNIKNIHYGDIHRKFPTIVNVEKDVNTYIKDTSYLNKYELCKNGDLIFADASEDYDGIGKVIEVTNIDCDTVSGLHTIMARDIKDIFAPKYKGYYFNSPVIHNQLRVMANGFKVYGISKDNIGKLSAKIPSKEEQIKIAKTLNLLDKKIELQSKKIEDLKLFKKGHNKYIFKNNNQSFTLKDLLIEYNNKTTINNEYEILSSTADGIVFQNEYFNKQAASQDTTGYKIIPRGYITYRSMSDTGKFHFNEQNKVDFGIVSPAYPVFKINGNIVNEKYLLYYMNENKDFENQILSTKEGGTRFALSFTKLLSLNVNLPNKEEQNNFSKIIDTINKKIDLEKRKLDKLNNLKKGLMQNMFV